MKRLSLILVLLLCGIARADHLSDLKSWPGSGLPVAAEWNVTGYPITWHCDQIRAGHRLFPTFNDLGPANDNVQQAVDRRIDELNKVSAERTVATQLQYLSSIGAPIALRPNINWTDAVGQGNFVKGQVFTPPISYDFPMVLKRLADGTITDTNQPDPLASTVGWTKTGQAWANSLWVKRVQALHQSPSAVLLLDNNEGPKLDLRGLTITAVKPPNSKVVPRTWLPPDQLATKSLRAVPWAIPGDVYPQTTEWFQRISSQYRALSESFKGQLTPSWQAGWMSGAYKVVDDPNDYPDYVVSSIGPAPQALNYDCVSEKVYCNPDIRANPGGVTADFTSPWHVTNLNQVSDLWTFYRAKNPKLYVELFTTIGQGSIKGWAAGLHDPIDPVAWQGYLEWVMWTIHRPGMPLILRDYRSSRELATENILISSGEADDNGTTSTTIPEGFDKYTKGDYGVAACKAVDHISEQSTLREAWLSGKPVPVFYPSEPSPYRAAVIQMDQKFLIYVWSPKKNFSNSVTVQCGIQTATVTGAGYWVASPPPATGLVVSPLEVK